MAAPQHDGHWPAADRPASAAAPEAAEERSGEAPDSLDAMSPRSGNVSGEPVEPDLTLPGPVRQRVITLVSAVLSDLADDEIPGALRRIARFAPQRRPKLGGAAIAAQLASDPLFRQRVADRVTDQAAELGEAVRQGACPAAADPVEVAALAYLARPEGWAALVDSASDAVRAAVQDSAAAERVRAVEDELARSRAESAAAQVEVDRLRERVASLAAEGGSLQEQVRQLNKALREAEKTLQRSGQLLSTEKGRAARAASEHDAEARRLRAKLADAEEALQTARRGGREVRAIDDARLWLLLETIGQAAHGLRRELALDPSEALPADFVAASSADSPSGLSGLPGAVSSARALAADDPSRLDQLLGLPKCHLIVDGYNVTKRGFGEVSLEQQRQRLVSGLGALAAQTGAEVTVAFDGAERMVGLPPAPRGVRVLFSRKGQTADELIRKLARAEPDGRPVVVISSDREVADGVRRHGAFPLGADTLLRRLARS